LADSHGRSAHAQSSYVINSKEISLSGRPDRFVQVAGGQEAVRSAGCITKASLGPQLVEQLRQLKARWTRNQTWRSFFGSELSGAAISDLVGFASNSTARCAYMALGDYANSRGAADMGVLPDRGPGYARLPSRLTAPHMIEAAQNGS